MTVDARSDLFALGVVLYEMVSGSRPFQGDSGAALVSNILTQTPLPLTDRHPDVSWNLGRIVQPVSRKGPRQPVSDGQRCSQSAADTAQGDGR